MERQPYHVKASLDQQRHAQQFAVYQRTLVAEDSVPKGGSMRTPTIPTTSQGSMSSPLRKVKLSLSGVSSSSQLSQRDVVVVAATDEDALKVKKNNASWTRQGVDAKIESGANAGTKGSRQGSMLSTSKGAATNACGKRTTGSRPGQTQRLKKARSAYQIFVAEMRPRALAEAIADDKARERSLSGRKRKIPGSSHSEGSAAATFAAPKRQGSITNVNTERAIGFETIDEVSAGTTLGTGGDGTEEMDGRQADLAGSNGAGQVEAVADDSGGKLSVAQAASVKLARQWRCGGDEGPPKPKSGICIQHAC
jgi:hypothetical protein